MNLGQLILETRTLLGELNPSSSRFTDQQLTNWLNQAAQLVCAEAQLLVSVYKTLVTAGRQEYALPLDADEVSEVRFHNSSTLYKLTPGQQVDLQFGTQVRSTPVKFYTRRGLLYENQDTDGNISITEVERSAEEGRQPRLIVGLYPVPDAGTDYLLVSYFAIHYQMTHNADVPAIPAPYQEGLIHFAAMKAKDQIHDLVEKDKHKAEFNEYMVRVREKLNSGSQQSEFPRWETPQYGSCGLGGQSTWIHVGNADYS